MKLILPEIPPSNNRYIGRNQRWAYQAEKQRWHWLVAAASRAGATRWNYLERVFARCSSRGLTTRDACEQYDTDRAWAQEHGGEPSGA